MENGNCIFLPMKQVVWYRGVFRCPYHPSCRVWSFWLPTVGCWKIEEFLCFTLKSACYSSKQTDLSFIQDNLSRSLEFSIDNRHVFRIRLLICNKNVPLVWNAQNSFVSPINIGKTSEPQKMYIYNSIGLRSLFGDYDIQARRFRTCVNLLVLLR